MWPDSFDANTYILPAGNQWVYSDSSPDQGFHFKGQIGWAKEPLWVSLRNQQIPVIEHLLQANFQAGFNLKGAYIQSTLPTTAVWNGPVGLGDMQTTFGYAKETWQVRGLITLPTATQDSPLDLRTQYQVSGTLKWTNTPVRLTLQGNAHLKSEQLGWSASAGVGWKEALTLESRVEWTDIHLWEGSLGYRFQSDHWTFQPAVSLGFLEGPGNAKTRVLFAVSPRKPLPVNPLLPVVQVAPVEPPRQPEPLQSFEPMPEPPPGYEIIRQLVDVLGKHHEIVKVRLEVHTSCEGNRVQQQLRSKKAAEQILVYLTQKGIAEERIELVPMGAKQPLVACPEQSPEQRKKNRRVDAIIVQVK